MPGHINVRIVRKFSALSIIAASACVAGPVAAEEVDATGKGITGGALLGGELVMAVEAAFGVQNTWAYVGGGLAGAAAGGVGGYFIEQGSDAKPSFYMLAGGMALIIPTTVAVLQATSYKAPDHYIEDAPGDTTPASEPPRPAEQPAGPSTVTVTTPEATAPSRTTAPVATTRPHIPISLVDLHDGSFSMGVPAVELRPTYTPMELSTYGVSQKTELRLPVFRATF